MLLVHFSHLELENYSYIFILKFSISIELQKTLERMVIMGRIYFYWLLRICCTWFGARRDSWQDVSLDSPRRAIFIM